jgi:outer membrane lipoprotein-sorting protein
MWPAEPGSLRMARLERVSKRDTKITRADMQIRIRRRAVLILAAGSALLAAGIQAQEIRDGETLLRAMHDRYQNNWYETLTFTQKSSTHNDDGTDKSEIWHEAMLLPGKLRIDIGPPADGNGMLVANGALTSFQNGKASDAHPFVHMLLVLGFDVYRQSTQATIDQVKSQGLDLTKLREDTWDGEPVYVVGADKGDMKSKQFWVEKKRLLFVRMIAPDRRDAAKTADSRFADYRQLPVGWVAARVEFFVDGKNVFSEEYSEIQTNPKLDPAIFDPKQFNSQHWEK